MLLPNEPYSAVSITLLPQAPSIVIVPAGQPAKFPPPPALYVYVALLLLLPAEFEKLTV